MIKNPEMPEVQNGVQGSVSCVTPSPGTVTAISFLCVFPEREHTHTHRQARQCLLACFPSGQCAWEIVLRSIFIFCSFTVSCWIGGCVDCFQLFATLNKVAVNDLEEYPWPRKSRG